MSVTRSPVSVKAMSIMRSSLAKAIIRSSWLNDMVRTGHSRRLIMRRQASSLASHKETCASAEPVAKYLPGNERGIFRYDMRLQWLPTRGSELNANAVGGMGLQGHLVLETGIAEDMHAAESVG